MAHAYWSELPARKEKIRGMVFCQDLPAKHSAAYVLLESQPFRIGHHVSIRLKDESSELLVQETRRILTLRGAADYVRCIPCGKDLDKALSIANELLDTLQQSAKTQHRFSFTRKSLEHALLSHYSTAAQSRLRILEQQQREERKRVAEELASSAAKRAGFDIH